MQHSLKQQLKRLAYIVETAVPVVATATVATTTMCVEAPYYRKDMLVRAKLQGFDNATQPQKPHWDWASERPVFAFLTSLTFTAEISENEVTFLDTVVFKGERFIKESILDIKTHYKPTETFGGKKRLHKRRSNKNA